MKLSFSIPKSRPSVAAAAAAQSFESAASGGGAAAPPPQFVTVFDPKTPAPAASLPPIPPIPNSDIFRPQKKLKTPLPEAISDPDTHFILDTSAADTSTVYGLQLRSKPAASPSVAAPEASGAAPEVIAVRSFKDDLSQLSDDRGFDEFSAVPVDGFGAAVLAGYGWKEGMAIGRSGKEDPKVVEYSRRQLVTAGLGYVPAPGDPKSSKHRHQRVAIEEKKARVAIEEVKPVEKSSNGGGGERWLRRDIRVRIVSKEFRKGKLYRQKGRVVELVGRTACVVKMDESGEVVEGVEQGVLETALPKRGGRVVVLYGKHKGVFGGLVEKDMDEETGVVEEDGGRGRVKVNLDQIAEYVGDRSKRGH